LAETGIRWQARAYSWRQHSRKGDEGWRTFDFALKEPRYGHHFLPVSACSMMLAHVVIGNVWNIWTKASVTYQKLGYQGLPLAHVLRAVLRQPLPALLVVGQGTLHAQPELRRVVRLDEVRQLVDDDVLHDARGQKNRRPVEVELAGRARRHVPPRRASP